MGGGAGSPRLLSLSSLSWVVAFSLSVVLFVLMASSAAILLIMGDWSSFRCSATAAFIACINSRLFVSCVVDVGEEAGVGAGDGAGDVSHSATGVLRLGARWLSALRVLVA